METVKKIYTEKKYLRPLKCLENGIVYNNVKQMCSVVYGSEFKNFNQIGRIIEKGRPVRGSHYIFI